MAASVQEEEEGFKCKEVCGRIRQMWPLLLCAGLETAVGVVRGLIFFPFLRTTIDCDPDTPLGFDKSSTKWSGSDYCADRCKVAEDAQLVKGIADGVELGLQCLCLPMLGFLADVVGRKPLVILSLSGLAASCALMGVAAAIDDGDRERFLVTGLIILASAIKGCTECGFAAIFAMIADTCDGVRERGSSFGILQVAKTLLNVVGVAIGAAILSQNLSEYDVILFGIALLAILTATLSSVVLTETLPDTNKRSWECKEANPFVNISILRKNSYITTLAVFVFFLAAAASIVYILQAFIIAAYSYTQTTSAIILAGLMIVVMLAAIASIELIKRYGNRKIFLSGLTLGVAASFIFVAAPYTVVCFLIATFVFGTSVIGGPSFQGLLSRQVLSEDQAKLQGAISSVFLAAMACFAPIYSQIFHQVGSGGDCSDGDNEHGDVDDALVWAPFVLSATMASIAYGIVMYWMTRFSESDDTPGCEPPGDVIKLDDADESVAGVTKSVADAGPSVM